MVREFTQVEKVSELSSGGGDENATFTRDMLEVYFESPDRDNGVEGHDIWWARRDSVNDRFEPPEPLPDWGGTGFDSSPAISSDGLTLWLAHERSSDEVPSDATTDIYWVTRRDRDSATWIEPQEATSLNLSYDERPRPLGGELAGKPTMPLSRRIDDADGTLWQTLLAEQNEDGSFETPKLLDELDDPDVGIVDGFLSEDGLTLLFKGQAPGEDGGDLYWSKRRDVSEPFRGAVKVPGPDINTDSDERDPWLSPDERTLYFVSNREGEMNIYRATWDERPVADDETAP
jgi:hypothetical protein